MLTGETGTGVMAGEKQGGGCKGGGAQSLLMRGKQSQLPLYAQEPQSNQQRFLAALQSEQMPKSGAGLRIKPGFNRVVWPLLMKLYLAGALAVAGGHGHGCGGIYREGALVPGRRGGKGGKGCLMGLLIYTLEKWK